MRRASKITQKRLTAPQFDLEDKKTTSQSPAGPSTRHRHLTPPLRVLRAFALNRIFYREVAKNAKERVIALRRDNQSAPSLKLTGSIKALLKKRSKAPHRASFGGKPDGFHCSGIATRTSPRHREVTRPLGPLHWRVRTARGKMPLWPLLTKPQKFLPIGLLISRPLPGDRWLCA